MAKQMFHIHSRRVDRRRFLVAAVATVTCTGVAAPIEQVEAAGPEVIRIGPPERARSDIEAWNVGLTPAENQARDAELRTEIRHCFGLLYLRGR